MAALRSSRPGSNTYVSERTHINPGRPATTAPTWGNTYISAEDGRKAGQASDVLFPWNGVIFRMLALTMREWGQVGSHGRACRPAPARNREGAFMHTALTRPLARRAARIGTAAALALGTVAALGFSQAPATAGSAGSCSPTVSKQFFGSTIEPYTGKMTKVFRYTLANCNGMQVNLLTFGAIQQSIWVPGRNGKLADVILGFKTLQDYVAEDSPPVTMNGGPYFGENIGRYGNRIALGKFTLDGVTYHLPINNGVNSLHGGLIGFGDHVYAAKAVHRSGSAGVAMTIVSPNGDQGYPGTLTETVTFTLNNSNQLGMQYHATVAGKATVINFTNHDYFNLAGEASGATYGQKVQINANRYTPTDKTQIPTGVLAPVAGTPFDFRAPHTIGSRINQDNPQLLIAPIGRAHAR